MLNKLKTQNQTIAYSRYLITVQLIKQNTTKSLFQLTYLGAPYSVENMATLTHIIVFLKFQKKGEKKECLW